MFKIQIIEPNITISINANTPDKYARIKIAGEDANNFGRKLAQMYGIYGHLVGTNTTPLDLNAALANSGMEYEILEGADILKMRRQQLPPGAKW